MEMVPTVTPWTGVWTKEPMHLRQLGLTKACANTGDSGALSPVLRDRSRDHSLV